MSSRRHHRRRVQGATEPQILPHRKLNEPRELWGDPAALWLRGDRRWKAAAEQIDQAALIELREQELTPQPNKR